MTAHTLPGQIVNRGTPKHVVRDPVEFTEYLQIPTTSQYVYIGNGTREDVFGVGTYMDTGRTLILYGVLYTLEIQNLLCVFALLGFRFVFMTIV